MKNQTKAKFDSNGELAKSQISGFHDPVSQSHADNTHDKTCSKKDKRLEEIRKSAEPLDIQRFRKRYPHHSNNHTLIRHIVLCKWRASREMISRNQP